MAASFFARADDIFTIGPETLVAQAPAIITGPVSDYNRFIKETSTPPHSIPVRWTARGHVSKPRILKGTPRAGFVEFSRDEQAIMLPPDGSQLYWEELYGDVQPEGQVIVFFLSDDPKPPMRTVPSGVGEQDLVELVENAVAIQKIEDRTSRIDRWLSYLETARSTEGRKMALRSAMQDSVEWSKLEPILRRIANEPWYNLDLRVFAFTLTAFHVTRELWTDDQRDAAIGYMLRSFATEADGGLVLQYLDHLGVIIDWAGNEDFAQARLPIRQRVLGAIKQRPSIAINEADPVDRHQEQEYREAAREIMSR